jgi:hypothetical protein
VRGGDGHKPVMTQSGGYNIFSQVLPSTACEGSALLSFILHMFFTKFQNVDLFSRARPVKVVLFSLKTVLTSKITTMSKFSEWMEKTNKTFSIITGEKFTNAEVIYTHIGAVLVLVITGVACHYLS